MSDFERKPLSLQIALFLDDQVARLSAWGHRFELGWQSLNRFWDWESIGAFCSRRDFQVGRALSWLLRPGWWALVGLVHMTVSCWDCLVQSKLVRPWLVLLPLAIFGIVSQPFRGVISFGREFLRSRRPALWLWLAAAFMIIIPSSVGALFGSFFVGQQEVRKAYQQAIQSDIESGNLDRVGLYQVKLAELGNNPSQLAMSAVYELASQGKLQTAASMAERLAPRDRPGLAAAHLYLTLLHLRNDLGLEPTQACQLAERHLDQLQAIHRSLAGDQSCPPVELQYLIASLRIRQDRVPEGLAILQRLSPQFWPATQMSLELHVRLGNHRESLEESQRLFHWAQRHPQLVTHLSSENFSIWFGQLADDDSAFAVDSNLAPQAEWIAAQWFEHFPEDAAAAQALLITFQAKLLRLAADPRQDRSELASLINQKFKTLEAGHRHLLESWATSQLTLSSPEAGEVYALAQRASLDPQAPTSLLEMLSAAEFTRGNQRPAYDLLKRVVTQDPNRAKAWNNLAVLIKRNRWESLESAYEYSTQAIQLEPEASALRLTRAMIAMDLQRWDSARLDLELVLKGEPDQTEVHHFLALVYQHLGETDRQQFHALLAGQ